MIITALVSGSQDGGRLLRSGDRAHDGAVPSATISHLQRWQQDNFALFRTHSEGLPTDIKYALEPPKHGLNSALAQRLARILPMNAWAVPGDGWVCLVAQTVSESIGVTCGRSKKVLREGLAVTFLDSPSVAKSKHVRSIVGIAPDHTKYLIAYARNTATKIATAGNVFLHVDAVREPPSRFKRLGNKPKIPTNQ